MAIMIRTILLVFALTIVHQAAAMSLELQPTWKCPGTKCQPGCKLQYAESGCTCTCPETCETMKCAASEICVMRKGDCITTSCYAAATCITNPIYPILKKLIPDCLLQRTTTRWVYNKTENTCQSIEVRGCLAVRGTYETEKDCREKNGLPAPVSCKQVACGVDCYRYQASPDQCPRCICPNPCQTVKCSSGYECRVHEVQCFAPGQCDPVAGCAKIE